MHLMLSPRDITSLRAASVSIRSCVHQLDDDDETNRVNGLCEAWREVMSYQKLYQVIFNDPARCSQHASAAHLLCAAVGDRVVLAFTPGGVRGAITSINLDRNDEVGVRWDDGTTSGSEWGGLQCGKAGVSSSSTRQPSRPKASRQPSRRRQDRSGFI
ncbi:hypothetical protein T492DRAFT_844134 [Pavlovales sp. CCMP2436]|nr:hypothetical protein T492DRAFT_844134 [Pavlovales sp. CCMP2436]